MFFQSVSRGLRLGIGASQSAAMGEVPPPIADARVDGLLLWQDGDWTMTRGCPNFSAKHGPRSPTMLISPTRGLSHTLGEGKVGICAGPKF